MPSFASLSILVVFWILRTASSEMRRSQNGSPAILKSVDIGIDLGTTCLKIAYLHSRQRPVDREINYLTYSKFGPRMGWSAGPRFSGIPLYETIHGKFDIDFRVWQNVQAEFFQPVASCVHFSKGKCLPDVATNNEQLIHFSPPFLGGLSQRCFRFTVIRTRADLGRERQTLRPFWYGQHFAS